jgi:hypothetical protein
MSILKLPQLLLIAGNGRDSGKTTLACLILQKFSPSHRIFSLKISPHTHRIAEGGKVICDAENLYIAEETDRGTGKDSSRMLDAGASRSFFVCSAGDQLSVAIKIILELADEHTLLVCESGGLRRFAEPGLFFIVDRFGSEGIKQNTQNLLEFENIWLTFDGHHFNLNLDEIVIHHNRWKKKDSHDFV